MRVLVIANDFPWERQPESGIFVLRQLQALRKLGHEPLVTRIVARMPPIPWKSRWMLERAIPERDNVDGIPVRNIRAFFAPRMAGLEYLHAQVAARIRRLVREFEPTVVHAQFLLPAGHIAVHQPLPCVVTAHGSDAYDWCWRRPGLRRAAAQTVRRADALAAVSDFIKERVLALAPRDVDVIYNGADETAFAPASRGVARALLGIEQGAFVVAFAGRLSAAKGCFDLVRAVARMPEHRALLLLAGPASAEALRHLSSLSQALRVLGTLPHDRLAQIFAAADVVALPSYAEGLPVVLCEAMLAARPVVATTIGGIPEIVANGERGFLVAPGDVAALAARLEELARDRDRAARMGESAHAFARTHLTWSINARRYDSLYRRIAERAAAAALPSSPSHIQGAAR